ncbi:MAG: response regulator [Proteobacteria bacterium]|nr:response regulator [Pseudomonadota bacterium]
MVPTTTSRDPIDLLGCQPRRIVIVDDERAVLLALERAFLDAGVKDVMTFEDGTSASRVIASGAAVDAFVVDWRLPDLGGLALINRIRGQVAFDRSPVLVLSGFLDKRDFRLAAEFPLLALVEKPSHANFVFKKLGELFRERDFFDAESQTIATEIQSLVPRDNFIDKGWEALRSKLRQAPRPAPVYFIAMRLLRGRGMENMSEILLQDLLNLEPDCAPALIEMGRKKIAAGNLPAATKLLQRAENLAPRNLERLCLLGDAQIRSLRSSEARETFTEATAVDPKDDRVISGLQIATNMERHLGLLDTSKMQGSLASMLNAIGVVMVREGKIEDGVHHYQSAIRYAENDVDWIKLGFNLGLAYMRWQKPLDASVWFKRAWDRSKGSFFKAKRHFDQALVEVHRLGLKFEDHPEMHLASGGDVSEGSSIVWPEGDKLNPANPSERAGTTGQGLEGAGGKLLPPPEFPPDLYAWDKIRKVLRPFKFLIQVYSPRLVRRRSWLIIRLMVD